MPFCGWWTERNDLGIACALEGDLYDVSVLDALDSLTSDWDRAQVIQMQRAAAMDGIRGKGATWSIHKLAAEVLELSGAGLARLGQEEERYLNPLREIIESETTRADRLIAAYQDADSSWNAELAVLA